MQIMDLLTGRTIVEEVDSKINGKLIVMRDLAWGTYIKAGGLTQSGGIVKKIWKEALESIRKKLPNIKKSLVLGLGGGSATSVIRENWKAARIIGVDIDPLIVELGKKYLSLNDIDVKVEISDAFGFVKSSKAKTYDLICIDLYNGDKFPEKFEKEEFIKAIHKSLSKKGVAVFNRLYYDTKRGDAVRFMKKLEKVFKKVEAFYPEANMMYICKNG